MRRIGPGVFLMVLLLAGAWTGLDAASSRDELVVFLVRHAEKEATADDPALSAVGQARARALADWLRDAGIRRVHSTDTRRTRDTAAPLAQQLGVTVEDYDPHDQATLVARLRQAGGRHLVIGHSNTVPAAVELLGGAAGDPIDEAAEYDRLYVVTVPADGQTTTVLLRYPSGAGP